MISARLARRVRRLRHPARCAAAALTALSLGACAAPPPAGETTGASSGAAPAASAGSDQARLEALERAARGLAKAEGCTASAGCRSAPVGWKACGGPRTFVVYCAATTDSAALFRKLDELKTAEMAYNEKSGMMSDCMLRLPPNVVAEGGSCRESR